MITYSGVGADPSALDGFLRRCDGKDRNAILANGLHHDLREGASQCPNNNLLVKEQIHKK